MIVVDTSVWVDALGRGRGGTRETLASLLDADEVVLALPVRIELLAGVSKPDRAKVTRAVTGVPLVVPTEETWRRVEKWLAPAADAGHRFGLIDLMIAALADELGALVWSLDSDFDRLADLELARLYPAQSAK